MRAMLLLQAWVHTATDTQNKVHPSISKAQGSIKVAKINLILLNQAEVYRPCYGALGTSRVLLVSLTSLPFPLEGVCVPLWLFL